MAYLCVNCNTVHGFEIDIRVAKVTRRHKIGNEDVWYCPKCGKQHRSSNCQRQVNVETLGHQVFVCDRKGGAYMSFEGIHHGSRWLR